FKLGLGLVAVIVLILVLQRLARRFSSGLPRRGEPIQLLAQRPLGPRLSVAVVEVMDRTLLVGISPHGISRVADLTAARARQGARRSALEEQTVPEPALPLGVSSGWKERVVRGLAAMLSRKGRSVSSGPAVAPTPHGMAAIAVAPDAAPPAPSSTEPPAGFEAEFRRRLSEIQARYPQLADLETKSARGTR
ncbi:MAG: FliO/MopB family protein, partial [Candidatus Eisenbacteria bacterium]|nr:FliO/MopB family protein [Candidatus Eisenbacteria bacterium]